MLDAARTGWILLVPRLRRVGSTRRVARSLSKPRRNVWDVWRDRAWPGKRDTGDQVPAVGPVDWLADAEARRVGGHQRAGRGGGDPEGGADQIQHADLRTVQVHVCGHLGYSQSDVVAPGGPASTLGTYSSSCSRPSKVRLLTMSRATSG